MSASWFWFYCESYFQVDRRGSTLPSWVNKGITWRSWLTPESTARKSPVRVDELSRALDTPAALASDAMACPHVLRPTEKEKRESIINRLYQTENTVP